MFEDKHLVIVGGSSGIGLRVARRALAQGARVTIGGRSQSRLDQAIATLPGAHGFIVDSTSRGSLQAFFARTGRIDCLFTPGASYQVGGFADSDQALAESPFRGKFWAQYWAVHAALPQLADDAAIVLVSGAASARPLKGGTAYAAANAAVEGLGRALAVELAPRRVNVIAPGTLDGELWQSRPQAMREAVFAYTAASTLLGRVGTVDDAADAALFLLGNAYTTGSCLYPDGGYSLR